MLSLLFLSLSALSFPTVLSRPSRNTLPPSFSQIDFDKRPLNFYVIANAKHAKVENHTVQVNAHPIPYMESTPPFRIKQRGEIVLFPSSSQSSSFFNQGHPSIIKMLAASGHRVIVPDMPKDNHGDVDVTALISAAEVHNPVMIGYEDADWSMVRYIQKGGRTDGIVLIDPKRCQGVTKCYARKFSEEIIETPLLILSTLSSLSNTSSVVGDLFKERQVISIGKNEDTEEGRIRLLKVINNLLEYIHPR